MVSEKLNKAFEGLIEKYSERLTGDVSPEVIEKIKIMAMYSYINKSMPPLVNHWSHVYESEKHELKEIFAEIKHLNESLKNK